MAKHQHYLAEVRDQYEDYPYPHRTPEDEKHRLLTTFTDALALMNYHCFEGKESFDRNFRVLMAGGGTGDGTIYLAEQLKHTNAEIVHLDISSASISIAQQRAHIRGLKNITFLNESLLDAANLGIGEFDYINCSGVLHHLEAPERGLSALTSVLKDSGAMSIMLYAPYGRSGIYMMQDIMRMLAANIPDKQKKIDLTKNVMEALPQQNLYNSMKQMVAQEISTEKDAGIYDLFLHSQDRPFSVPQIYEMLESAGLHLLEFLFIGGIGKSLYDPLSYVKDEKLRGIISQKDRRTRHILAELLAGNLTTHSFYCAKTPRTKPSPQAMECIPIYNALMGDAFPTQIINSVRNAPIGSTVKLQHNGAVNTYCLIEIQPYVAWILQRIDGKTSLMAIFEAVALETGANRDALMKDWLTAFKALNLHDWLLLKSK